MDWAGSVMASSFKNSLRSKKKNFKNSDPAALLCWLVRWPIEPEPCASATLHIWILQSNCWVLPPKPEMGLGNRIVWCNWIAGTFCFNPIILIANRLGFTLIAACEFFLNYFLVVISPNVCVLDCDCFLQDVDIAWSKWDSYTKWKEGERVWAYGWRL